MVGVGVVDVVDGDGTGGVVRERIGWLSLMVGVVDGDDGVVVRERIGWLSLMVGVVDGDDGDDGDGTGGVVRERIVSLVPPRLVPVDTPVAHNLRDGRVTLAVPFGCLVTIPRENIRYILYTYHDAEGQTEGDRRPHKNENEDERKSRRLPTFPDIRAFRRANGPHT
ncbi:hypothetical protein Pcinc_026990 [Petrolisthes cinctipes]|uniref:Uncharacterized protein n=1 Tax=Petrolisthes cinctipes TaxID=88211 RepID=A0AAE1F5Z1_PETCI|nr:hypothetical protein Pcinc_026990 [Petrolisthes cinctipes]